MYKLLSLVIFTFGVFVNANQIVYTTTTEDFNPLKKADWKVMVGNATMNQQTSQFTRSGSGISVAIERKAWNYLSAGAQFGILRSNTTQYGVRNDGEIGEVSNFKEALKTFTLYGKMALINYPINKWNLLQINLLAGASQTDQIQDSLGFVYGASMAYNYDNLIGFEVDSKLNEKAEPMTSASFIGYF